ncbi:MAG: S8 family serine peptidase, partial [Armatimonadota bacterium]
MGNSKTFFAGADPTDADDVAISMNKTSITLLFCCLAVTAAGAALSAPIMLRSGDIAPLQRSDAQLQALAPKKGGYYVLQLKGPVLDEWKVALAELGVQLKDYIPENAYVVHLTPKLIPQVKALSFVSYLDRLQPKYRLEPRVKQISSPQIKVLIKLFPSEGISNLYHILRAVKGVILPDSQPASGIVIVSIPQSALDRIAGLEEVQWVEEWVAPRVINNVAATIMGLPEMRQRASLYGAGQIIAFADTGLDTGSTSSLSADFAGRLFKAYGIRRPGDWSDVGGHGTFVLGCAVGSGVLSGSTPGTHTYTGSFAGVAPEASIIIQSIGDSTGFVYPPVTLTNMFQPPYTDGARVHSNSWGSPVMGNYTTYSQQLDDFVWNHKDSVIVFPSGNDGRDANSNGLTDPTSLYAPATAKNCIT